MGAPAGQTDAPDPSPLSLATAIAIADRHPPTTLADALARMEEAEDTLRAIGAGEIDAFVVADGGAGRKVFTLSTADRPYRKFVENMRDGAATLSATGLILYVNGRLAELLGRNPADVVGSPLTKFVLGGDLTIVDEVSRSRALGTTVELDLVASNGTRVPVLVGVSSLEVDGTQLSCLTFTDLSEQKAQDEEISRLGLMQAHRLTELQDAQAALTRQATHDALTGLPNRGLIIDRIDQALAQAARSGRCTAVFFVDLDSLKRINDTLGHATGDEVLRSTSKQLLGVLRSMDSVARIGGDEFVVLAHDVDNEMHAIDIGTRLVTEVSQWNYLIGDSGPVTASVGIAVSIGGRGDAEGLLDEADSAMYLAKSRGGNRVAVFDAELALQALQRAGSRRVLQTALDQHKVIAHYQPIVNLPDGHIAGFEALARISAVDGSVVQPSAFISIAEESGLVIPLGAEVLGLACTEATGWRAGPVGSLPLTVAVNLSSRQFENRDLVATVRDRLERAGLEADRLHLELTETATIDLRRDVIEQLNSLRDLGVEIGLDDFGTGYGSLTHLRKLPLTFVKIDRSFVDGLGSLPEDERIVSAVVNLAANLGLRSIAEGVETTQQLSLLREIGCDQAQGYLFARPMPTDRIPDALADGRRLTSHIPL